MEWLGGTAPMPKDEDGTPDPVALVWMDASDGAVRGAQLVGAASVLAVAIDSLELAIRDPMFGSPGAPDRLRVASAELAGVLRAAHPEIDVVCGPTPEMDPMFALVAEQMLVGERSYLTPGLTPKALAAFFTAVAELYRANPWDMLPDDRNLLTVTMEPFHMTDAVVCVFGRPDEMVGFALFRSLEAFHDCLESAPLVEQGQGAMTPHVTVTYEPEADMPEDEVSKHGWEVADANAYPWVVVVDEEDHAARPPTAEELSMVEATARAMTQLVLEKVPLRAAWLGGEPVLRTLSVPTQVGEVEVTVGVLCEEDSARPVEELLPDLVNVAGLDQDAKQALEEELLAHFFASPEAEGSDASSYVIPLVGLAPSHGHVAALNADELRRIIFEVFPRKLTVDPSTAGQVIADIRKLYAFLKRVFHFRRAGDCLRMLDEASVPELEAAFANSSNFGMAKSVFMAAADAGVELDSREDIEAFLRSIEGTPLPVDRAKLRSKKAGQTKRVQRKPVRKKKKKKRKKK